MAPSASVLKEIDKAEKERESSKLTITWLEDRLKDHATTPISESKINHYLNMVTINLSKVEDTFQRLILHVDAADHNAHYLEYTSLMDKVLELSDQFSSIKKAFVPATTTTTTAAGPTVADIRLPRLTLPRFSGKIEEWTSFRDMFQTAIHHNKQLSDSQKLTYLKAQLEGEAARQIQSLVISDANYKIAWDQLSDRYQNDRQLLFAILKRFTQQPTISTATASVLRQLIDVTQECIRSLAVLSQPVKQWDSMLLFLIYQKLDPSSKELYEQSLKDSSVPKLQGLFDFLEQRSRALEAGGGTRSVNQPHNKVNPNAPQRNHVHHAQSNNACKVCNNGGHPLFRCSLFLSKGVPERIDFAKKNSLCFNCLRPGHGSSECSSSHSCRICKSQHHTLLHRVKPTDQAQVQGTTNSDKQPKLTHHARFINQVAQTLLATAIISVQDSNGQQQYLRVLLDGGSNANVITSKAVKKLGLVWTKKHSLVTGLSMTPVGSSQGVIDIDFSPHFDQSFTITSKSTQIMQNVTDFLPIFPCNPDVPHLYGLQLADNNWHTPSGIDMLIGAGLFYSLLGVEKLTGHKEDPIARSSDLGWLIAGDVGNTSNTNPHVHTTIGLNISNDEKMQSTIEVLDFDLDRTLRSFWELEALSSSPNLTEEERNCEAHFVANTKQDEDGRFIVKLPFKSYPPDLGPSRDIAIQRLKQIERRFILNPSHKEEYVNFMQEYLELGHMEKVPEGEIFNPNTYYVPHHFVLKDSTTTKLRVVFDGSCKTGNGKSINQCLMVGPTIQDSLYNILLRFRVPVIAFTTDIAKMYRQILVTPADADYQRIVWRKEPNLPIEDFRLLRVTYGMGPSAYLATRSVKQLAINNSNTLPLASKIALRDFYIDDLMSGADTVAEALQIQSQMLELTKRGAMEARKWTSSNPALLQSLPEEMRETKSLLPMELGHTVKTLGIYWKPESDTFMFRIDTMSIEVKGKQLTKRIILSDIAKIFDPIGWLAPIVITAKIMMQTLWKLDFGWDDVLPQRLQDSWRKYKSDLHHIEKLQIPRCLKPTLDNNIALIGFCDSSELAYAAVCYLCVYPKDQSPSYISLITSKTRVAPAKPVSLPRLELCGAVLLARLMETVENALELKIDHKRAYSDSTVTLAWIQGHPSRWNRFVANRVTEIQDRLSSSVWGHVAGTENPADCATRGLDPSAIGQFTLWWNGPDWLKNGIPVSNLPTYDINSFHGVDMEERREIVCNTAKSNSFPCLLENSSSLLQLQRRTAWIKRFALYKVWSKYPDRVKLITGPLQPDELAEAMTIWVKFSQQQEFCAEIKGLQHISNPKIDPKSKHLSLNPFLDKVGVLRVGGRLRHAELEFDRRHPILLPRNSRLTSLLIISEHKRLFHCGPQLLLSTLQTRYWITRGRDVIRQQLRKCVTCTKQRAQTMQQMMADLPSFRVAPRRSFSKCGVDYAGPFLLRPMSARSKVTIKSYICIFVCCVTRAVHLELVSSLSTEAFIAALRRFIARRGLPTDIYSDCGTNFVGADRELKELEELCKKPSHNQKVSDELSSQGIFWHFNPPGAPHFGGLWEAGVKSVKFHLRRVMGQTRLTFEEMSTTITQIEAILNSRPISQESSDPSDLSALTPGHFLIGTPLVAAPDPSLDDVKTGRLNRWQLVQQMYQSFWQRWSNEYLTRLQQRPKWMATQEPIKIGDLVIIKDERMPPMTWRLGRVQQLHPGLDGHIRVVTLKTKDGILKRPIAKLCLLPVEH